MARIITYASGPSLSYYHEQCFKEALERLSMRIGDTGYNPTIGMVDDVNIAKNIVCIRCRKDIICSSNG